MLQIKNVNKEYRTGTLVQKALDDVSLSLRDSEFVAVLGPSGSGKTTLLNVIGGLDRYDSGELIINGISTKKYKERDWDSYRNHTIGFVFQSYNLIPHQSVLANVELALTISGVGKSERRKRAMEALATVGLADQSHKKPSQLSGGQMQRVAIARALVNNPDIVLADEPTGALDSETSLQVMELLREVAKDRLVVMVTHNPELADRYATRIVRLQDGRICSDSDPFEPTAGGSREEHRNMGKSSMSLWTSLSLSFNNLRTKKARTILTAFAGSIGIIGIALILSLSTGANEYIDTVEEDTLAEYPISIQSSGFDFTSLLAGMTSDDEEEDGEVREVQVVQMVTSLFSTMDSNDLTALKAYLESGQSEIKDYAKAIEYTYNVTPQIYQWDGEDYRQVNPDQSFSALGFGSSASSSSMVSSLMSTDMFYEMPENTALYEDQYDVKAGRWPQSADECVVVLYSDGSVSDFLMYTLGLRDPVELDEMVQSFINEENVDEPVSVNSYDYEDILGITFKLVSSADYYQYDSQYNVWTDKTGNESYMKDLVKNGEDLTVVGIVQESEDANGAALSAGIGYTHALTQHIVEKAAESEIVQSQIADPGINVFTGEAFGADETEQIDMSTLFSLDTDALGDAFAFDTDALSEELIDTEALADAFQTDEGTLDLGSALDFGALSADLSGLYDLSGSYDVDLETLFGGLDLSISRSDLETLARDVLAGYESYTDGNPQADYTKLGDAFTAYLQSEQAQEVLELQIREILQENGGNVTVSVDELQALLTEILSGYQSYAFAMGMTDLTDMSDSFTEYLRTSEAQAILNDYASRIITYNGEFSLTQDQMNAIASDLMSGFEGYADENNLPNFHSIGDTFLAYLSSDAGQERMMQGISDLIDTQNLQTQISDLLLDAVAIPSDLSVSFGGDLEEQVSALTDQMVASIGTAVEEALGTSMEGMTERLADLMGGSMQIDPDVFSDAFEMLMSQEELSELLMSLMSQENDTYESNLQNLDYADFANPTQIDIYPFDFRAKEEIVAILDDYNRRMEAEDESKMISYTDVVGTMMSSISDIIDIISYVLIAFVAISLVVSSIMIGVITYISVLERKKEIGILRSIGASRGNISQVFNAETFIIGLCAGVLGVGLSVLILIPGNRLIHSLAGTTSISAILQPQAGALLILLSVVLTVIGGLIPSVKAASSDPVSALRVD